jgi:hypothetical protein
MKIPDKPYVVSSASTSIFTGLRVDDSAAVGHKNEKAEESDLLFCLIKYCTTSLADIRCLVSAMCGKTLLMPKEKSFMDEGRGPINLL